MEYNELYDILIPKDNFWRQLNNMIDFSFVADVLKDKYSSTIGKTDEDIIRMFKYLLLKSYFKLSDKGLIKTTMPDMLFKYFLGYDPIEKKLIDPSLLTTFRREILVAGDDSLIDKLIEKTVKLALEKGIIEVKNKIIINTTNTIFKNVSPKEKLIKQTNNLTKIVYKIDATMQNKIPKINETTNSLQDQIDYTKELLDLLKEHTIFENIPPIKERMDYLKETMEDIELKYSKVQETKYEYQTLIATTPEKIITAVTITSGKKPSEKELTNLIEKSQNNGIEVIIEDLEYSNVATKNANTCEKMGITIQDAATIFLSNMKKIIK